MPSEIRFGVVRKMLESHGWQLTRIAGSHHIFVKPGSPMVVIPVHQQKVKPVYVRQLQKLFAEEEKHGR